MCKAGVAGTALGGGIERVIESGSVELISLVLRVNA